MKVAKEAELNLDDDPRSVRDPVMYNRLRVMIEEEAIKPTWGCPLYRAARRGGWLCRDQGEAELMKRAGDKYQQAYIDYCQAMNSDPREGQDRELAYRRVHRRKRVWKDINESLYGTRHMIQRFIIEEVPAITEREKLAVKDGLTLLVNFFGLRNKK